MAKPLIAYVRRSTNRQALTPASQRSLANEWAAREGRQIVHVVEDTSSGGIDPLDRPAFRQALDIAAEHGADIVIAEWDRFGRTTAGGLLAWASAKGRGVELLAVRGRGAVETAEDKFVLTLELAVAELEKAKIKRRTRQALQVKRKRGEPMGRAPFGWTYSSGALVPVEGEQRTLGRIGQLRAEGASWRAVADVLNEDGDTGRRWYPTSVRRVYQRAQLGTSEALAAG